jgi:polyhydroxybutyrate depolymerase
VKRCWLFVLLLGTTLFAACDGNGGSGSSATATATVTPTATPRPTPSGPVGGDRPVNVFVPSSYDAATPIPLVIVIHSFTINGAIAEAGFRLRPVAEERGFIYAIPEGTRNGRGQQFWNATSGCCDFDRSNVDDSGYLRRVIEDIQARWNVDAKRIFTIGLSNGGFMGHRLACDHPDLIAGIVSIAGATHADPLLCQPNRPVHILNVHGTVDNVIRFEGGTFTGPYPGAVETVQRWVELNGCGPSEPGEMLDVDAATQGAETRVTRYTAGCRPGGSVEFWEMMGAGHYLQPTDEFRRAVTDWFFAHAKP